MQHKTENHNHHFLPLCQQTWITHSWVALGPALGPAVGVCEQVADWALARHALVRLADPGDRHWG